MNGNPDKSIERLYDKFDEFLTNFNKFQVHQAGINAQIKDHIQNTPIHHDPPCDNQKRLTRLFWGLVTLNVISIVTLAAAIITKR